MERCRQALRRSVKWSGGWQHDAFSHRYHPQWIELMLGLPDLFQPFSGPPDPGQDDVFAPGGSLAGPRILVVRVQVAHDLAPQFGEAGEAAIADDRGQVQNRDRSCHHTRHHTPNSDGGAEPLLVQPTYGARHYALIPVFLLSSARRRGEKRGKSTTSAMTTVRPTS